MARGSYRSVFAALSVGALALALSGCAAQPAATGVVTFNGEAVDGGSIVFIPEGAAQAKVVCPIRDGKFSIPSGAGLSVGKNRVLPNVPTVTVAGVRMVSFRF